MDPTLYTDHYDLITPDGRIISYEMKNSTHAEALVSFENISARFVGFDIDPTSVFFNIKSSLAQLGVDGVGIEYELNHLKKSARVHVSLKAIGPVGEALLPMLKPGVMIGKLFAADDRRRVRDPEYLSRMFGRSDRFGNPLLSLGGMEGSGRLVLEKIDGRAVAFITLVDGTVEYDETIYGFLPTIVRALQRHIPIRHLLKLHQRLIETNSRLVKPGQMLLVHTPPLHIRTVFGLVADKRLSAGYHHTSACVLEPDRQASGDIYELFGNPEKELNDIPLEFYTLEPHKEHIFFSDRDQLVLKLEEASTLFDAFKTAPMPSTHLSAVFIAKGSQLLELQEKDWNVALPRMLEFPGMSHNMRQSLMVDRYIQQQPQYIFLRAMEDDLITSQGVLLSLYFPSPFLKRLLLSDQVQMYLKGLYFMHPSMSHGSFFSAEDRALLNDLAKFALPVYWVDQLSGKILQYAQKYGKDTGMFVPLDLVDHYLQSTVIGIYGSNLLEGQFENELFELLKQLLLMKKRVDHPLLNPDKPLSLVTGGGPGVMAVGNRVAKNLQILSCANIVDFSGKGRVVVNEQKQNPHVEAKMTYRIDKLVERQAEFNLDLPIFLAGGIGTDFELGLEEVRRKVGTSEATPVLLFGDASYWEKKITDRFQCNQKSGTIIGSEWISNCFYVITKASEALQVYERYFTHTLPIGKEGPIYPRGFCSVKDDLKS